MKFNIKNLFTNNKLQIFKESDFALAKSYDNIEKIQCLLDVTLVREISNRKCLVRIHNTVRTMYFYNGNVNITRNYSTAREHADTYELKNIICVTRNEDAVKVLHSQASDPFKNEYVRIKQ